MSETADFNERNIAEFRSRHGQVGGQFDVRATEMGGAERDEKYAEQAARFPGFVAYQDRTARVIPVLALTPIDVATGSRPS